MTAVLGMPFPEVAGQLEIWCMQSRFAWRHLIWLEVELLLLLAIFPP